MGVIGTGVGVGEGVSTAGRFAAYGGEAAGTLVAGGAWGVAISGVDKGEAESPARAAIIPVLSTVGSTDGNSSRNGGVGAGRSARRACRAGDDCNGTMMNQVLGRPSASVPPTPAMKSANAKKSGSRRDIAPPYEATSAMGIRDLPRS